METQITQLREDLRGYHGDVKRRLDQVEDLAKECHEAIHGIAGNDNVPGLNVEIQGLRAFRERVRVGIGAAWALILTIVTVLWNRK